MSSRRWRTPRANRLERRELSGRGTVVFRNDLTGEALGFTDPEALIVAWTADEFEAALAAAEVATESGKWLAGYFSYEAGYLFEPKLRPLLPDNRQAPLVCLGVFHGPAERPPDPMAASGQASIRNPVTCWSAERYRESFLKLHRHLAQPERSPPAPMSTAAIAATGSTAAGWKSMSPTRAASPLPPSVENCDDETPSSRSSAT